MKIYLVFHVLLLEKAPNNTMENKEDNMELLEENKEYKVEAILDY